MSLINDTLKDFFLKEYADMEVNKFVYLYQTGYKFDDSMFISPVPDENGKPFVSDAIASAVLSGLCDQIIAVPDSNNPNSLTSALSDKYKSILDNMQCAKDPLLSSFLEIKGSANEKFDSDDPVHIVSALSSKSYKTFYTLPYEWYADNGWQDPPYSRQFTLKPTVEETVAGKTPIRSFWKQSPQLTTFIQQSKIEKKPSATIVTDHRSSHAVPTIAAAQGKPFIFQPVPLVQPASTQAAKIRDHRTGFGGIFTITDKFKSITDQNHIISKPGNVVVKPVETDSLTIQFSFKILPVKIPWMEQELFGDIENYWYLPGSLAGQLSTGKNDADNQGTMPSYISDVIIVKDVSITGHFSTGEINDINASFGFEAFNLTDKQIPAAQPDGTIVIEDKGKQVLGFLCTVFPKCPSFGDTGAG